MLQDPVSSGFRATSFFRKHTDFFNVPQHFGGSTMVVNLILRDCFPVYTHKHISPSTVLSSNTPKPQRGVTSQFSEKSKICFRRELFDCLICLRCLHPQFIDRRLFSPSYLIPDGDRPFPP